MRYWYTVIFILLGVFILMAIIIKVCGKKTPLVRSRRKRRRQTIQHEQDIIDNPDDVQVHPTAIEPSVPLGKPLFLLHYHFRATFLLNVVLFFFSVKQAKRFVKIRGQRKDEAKVEKGPHQLPAAHQLHPSLRPLLMPISRLLWQPRARPKLRMVQPELCDWLLT